MKLDTPELIQELRTYNIDPVIALKLFSLWLQSRGLEMTQQDRYAEEESIRKLHLELLNAAKRIERESQQE